MGHARSPEQGVGLVEARETVADLRAALDAGDLKQVRELRVQLITQLESVPESMAEPARDLGRHAVRALRKKRRYRDSRLLGECLRGPLNDDSPAVAHEVGLCMVNSRDDVHQVESMLHRALLTIQRSLDDPGETVDRVRLIHERNEVNALLARLSKDRYFDKAGGGSPADLIQAIKGYSDAYDAIGFDEYAGTDSLGDDFRSQSDKSYVGQNAAELLWSAAARGIAVPGVPDPLARARSIAKDIVEALPEGDRNTWDYATLMSCGLILDDPTLAHDSLRAYLDSKPDVFALESTNRLFESLWQDVQWTPELKATLSEAISAGPIGIWLLPRSHEVRLDAPLGERYGVLVSTRWAGQERQFIVTSGDVAWEPTVTCHIDVEGHEPFEIELDVADSLVTASSPWLLDVTILDLERSGLIDAFEPARQRHLPIIPARDALLPADDALLLHEVGTWTARLPQATSGPLVGLSISRVRTDRRYLQFVPADRAYAPVGGAPVVDQQGRLVALQRCADPGQYEAVLWEAIASLDLTRPRRSADP